MGFLPNNKYAFKKGHKTWNKGIPRTEELKRKLSEHPKERLYLGKKHTEEERKRISLGRKGKSNPKEAYVEGVKTRKKNGSYIPWNKGKKIVKTKEELAGRPRPDTCEICNRPGRICFDHDHTTGKFRGWICHKCNAVLGFVNDRVVVLEKMAIYLKINS